MRFKGKVACKGEYKGKAFIHYSADLEGLAEMPEGAVLVTDLTTPPMTQYMIKAGAIVTERGGILSHAAIIAREYGIPCIVGAGGVIHGVNTTIRPLAHLLPTGEIDIIGAEQEEPVEEPKLCVFCAGPHSVEQCNLCAWCNRCKDWKSVDAPCFCTLTHETAVLNGVIKTITEEDASLSKSGMEGNA